MKKEVFLIFIFLLILSLSISFVSAFSFQSFFNDFFNNIIGKVTSTCTDTDNGLAYSIKGQVCDTSTCYNDFCFNSTNLFEFYCKSSQEAAGLLYYCSGKCVSGACIIIQQCTNYYYDSDKDNYGTSNTQCLTSPSGSHTATLSGDCDDTDSSTFPGATEICENNKDNDCDNSIDEGCVGVADTTPPTINIIYPIESVYNSHITTIKYTASDDVALDSCSYSLDEGITKTTTTCNQDITDITSIEGTNTWTVYAKDSSGNENFDEVIFSVDLTAIIQTCEDGTLYNECSTTKPNYCDSSGNLINNHCYGPDLIINTADDCGCPQDQQCQEDGSCSTVITEEDSDSDGIPDIHDPDANGDGNLDIVYSSLNPDEDIDGDGIININDDDIDGDGILNGFSFEGFIVELEGEPLVVQKTDLEEKAEANEGNILVQVMGNTLPKKIAPTTHSNLEGKMEDKREDLENQRESVKEKIKDELNKDSIITGSAVSENGNDLVVISEYENVFNGLALNVTPKEAEEIKDTPGVKAIYPNYILNITLYQSVPLINADDVWKLKANLNLCSGYDCLTGKGVTIGILDSGVDYTHPDLGGCTKIEFLTGICEKVVGGYDFVNNDNNPMDDHGHGTHVASIAAGNGALKGVAPDAKIYAYKVFGKKEMERIYEGGLEKGITIKDVITFIARYADVLAAIERSVDPNRDGDFSDHLDVISLSLGLDCGIIGGYSILCGPDDPASKAVDRAVKAGVVVVVSAGNSGPGKGTIISPATARKAISVGATDKYDRIASFSSRGPVIQYRLIRKDIYLDKPDVVAPGVAICAAQYDDARSSYQCLDNNYIYMSGTSMAAPHVSGVVALIKQAHPDWTPEEIKKALMDNAVDLGYDINTQGAGRVDVSKVLPANFQPPPPPAKDIITYSWNTGSWSSCSVSGNDIIKTRDVWCERKDGIKVDDFFCPEKLKPATTEPCHLSGYGCGECLWGKGEKYSCVYDDKGVSRKGYCYSCNLNGNQGRYYTGSEWTEWFFSEKAAACYVNYCRTYFIRKCIKRKDKDYNWQIRSLEVTISK